MKESSNDAPARKVDYHLNLKRFQFQQDYRARLPSSISRFFGFRPPTSEPLYEPLPIFPFTYLRKISLEYEVWIMGWIGAFVGILLIEAIMSTSTAFRTIYHAPTIVTSFGASAVLLFGAIESPLAQPRNFVLGHFVSALVGVAISRLFVRNPYYTDQLENEVFHSTVFINGGLSMATSLLVQLVTGNVHPPAGATGLNAAVEKAVVELSWNYLPTVIASSLIMLGWALVINNLGRRRYPIYWWSPTYGLVRNEVNEEEADRESLTENPMRQEEDLGRTPEALRMERMEEGRDADDSGQTSEASKTENLREGRDNSVHYGKSA